ncbi:MAG: TolC family protein [Verrucomicrobia subdivision 3 bacterium]|nr:TolC family protein [Limisphaerales bacterium]
MKAALMPILGAAVAFVAGCASTNPTAAFEDIGRTVTARTGHNVRWMRNDAERGEIDKAVDALLQSNLTAQSAITVALLNNRSLQAEFEEIGVSQAELAQVSRLSNPQFEGSWRLPNHGPKVVNAEYGLVQNFLGLLTLPARKKTAARNVEATKLRIAHQVLTLTEETQAAFYTVQAGQQLTNRLALIVEVSEAAAEIAKRQHEAGNITDLELQNQQAAYAQSRLDLARAQSQLRSDRERLNRLLGLWGAQTAWQVESELPPPPERELTIENIETLAVSQRFDLAAARHEVANVQSALKLKRSVRWLPAVDIGVDAEHDLDHAWVIGPTLSLEIPVFDQGQPELARLASEYRRAVRNFEALAVNIRSEVREARDAIVAARDVVEYYQKVLLPQRQRILRETLLQYNAMQLGNFVLLSAKEREALTERETIEALRDYWIARARLERAVGGTISPPAQTRSSQSPQQAKPTDSHEHHKH